MAYEAAEQRLVHVYTDGWNSSKMSAKFLLPTPFAAFQQSEADRWLCGRVSKGGRLQWLFQTWCGGCNDSEHRRRTRYWGVLTPLRCFVKQEELWRRSEMRCSVLLLCRQQRGPFWNVLLLRWTTYQLYYMVNVSRGETLRIPKLLHTDVE